jgi:deazaflavin-dependent oxidoreductase (nitroreductase family)
MQDYNAWNKEVIKEFRANGGSAGGQLEGMPLLLLFNTGAKSGELRINPLAYQKVDSGYAIFGSKGGSHTNPAWYHNLLSNPEVKIELGTKTFMVRARLTEGEERERIWAQQKIDFPQFAGYETKTNRQIPVLILEPI